MPEVGIPANCMEPVWPETNIRFGEPPTIDLAVLLEVTGAVLKIEIIKSTGARVFDDATRTALVRCKFPSLLRHGTPCAAG